MCSEETKQINHNEETTVTVQAVIKQFSKWCRRASSPRLLAVDAIQGVGNHHVNASDEENPSGNRGIVFNLRCCLKAIVVKRYQKIVDDGEHEAGKGEKIRCDPHGDKL